MIFNEPLDSKGRAIVKGGGNFVAIKKASGILTLTMSNGDNYQLLAGDEHEFDEEFESFQIQSSVLTDDVVINYGKGSEKIAAASNGGKGGGSIVIPGNLADDGFSTATGDKEIVSNGFQGVANISGKKGIIFVPNTDGAIFSLIANGSINAFPSVLDLTQSNAGNWIPGNTGLKANHTYYADVSGSDFATISMGTIKYKLFDSQIAKQILVTLSGSIYQLYTNLNAPGIIASFFNPHGFEAYIYSGVETPLDAGSTWGIQVETSIDGTNFNIDQVLNGPGYQSNGILTGVLVPYWRIRLNSFVTGGVATGINVAILVKDKA